jgi:hypothetical protein
LRITKSALKNHRNFLAVDDFVARGSTLDAVISMGLEGGLELSGVLVAFSKSYDPGREFLKKKYGTDVLSLANVDWIKEKGKAWYLHIDELFFKPADETLKLKHYDL